MQKQKLIWHTEKRKINDLIPFDKNPRQLTEKEEKDLKISLERFDLVEIPVIDLNNKILAGHQRIKILQLFGRGQEKIDVRIPNRKLSQKEFKEYLLRSNKNVGSWNMDLLKEFDIELLMDVGFDDSDLSEIWDENLEIENDEFDTKKEIEKIKSTEIKPGDLYKLGDHYLTCGDASNLDVIKKLTMNKEISALYCDPPFNIALDYNKGIGGKKNYGGKTNDNKSDEEYKEFLRKTIKNGLSVGKKDLHIFYYCDQKYIGLIQSLYQELGINSKRVCLWIKNGFNVTPQIAFNKCYEPCVYGTIGKPYLSPNIRNLDEILNKEVDTGNRAIDDILDILDIWLVKRLPGQEYTHPTEKPPSLHEKALKRCTSPGDIVLDLFAGSGSTLIACEQLKRRCCLVEIEPIFNQLIINRYEQFANQKAKKIN